MAYAILYFMGIFDFILHLDKHLANLISTYGTFTYVILFLIIFAETGLVITPFLPGDSLLFVVGTLSGSGFLNIWIMYPLFLLAAFLGDNVNYWIGHTLGPRVFSQKNSRIFNKTYLEKTHAYFTKHGGKTIIIARFVPIVRTFAPFVAGIGRMPYLTFISYSICGTLLWVTIFTFTGYFFGGLPIIKKNFEFAVVGVIVVSLLPMLYEYLKSKKENPTKKQLEHTNFKDIQKTFKK